MVPAIRAPGIALHAGCTPLTWEPVLLALCLSSELPTIEVVLPGTLAPAKSKSNQPYNGEDDRGNPQQMDGESCAEEDQNK